MADNITKISSQYITNDESFTTRDLSFANVQAGDCISVQYSISSPTAIPNIQMLVVANTLIYSGYSGNWGYGTYFTGGGTVFKADAAGTATIRLTSDAGLRNWGYNVIHWRGPGASSEWSARTAHGTQSIAVVDTEMLINTAGHRDWIHEYTWDYTPSGVAYAYISNVRCHDVFFKVLNPSAAGTITLNCSYSVNMLNMVLSATSVGIRYSSAQFLEV